MTTLRTIIRIDHEEGDPRMSILLSVVKAHEFTTSHQKGVVVTRALNGGKYEPAHR